jgi:signal transduction histidine kinase
VTVAQVSLTSISALLAISAFFVWRAFPQRAINRWFAAFGITTASWIAGTAGVNGTSHLEMWGRFTFSSATLIPATFLAFIRCYPILSRWPSSIVTAIFLAVGATIAVIGLFTPLLVYDVATTIKGLSRKTGLLYPFFLTYFIAMWLAALAVFFEKWPRQRGGARAQMQHLGIAILVSGTGAIAFNLLLPLLTGTSSYSWFGPYFSIPLVLIVAHAIIRHRLLDLRLVIGRTLAHGLVISLVSFAAVIAADISIPAGRLAVPLDPRLAIGIIVVLVMLSAPGQRILIRVVDPYLFRSRIDYSSALRDVAKRFSRLMTPDQLCEDLRPLLTSVFMPETFSMFVRIEESGRFEPVASDGVMPADAVQDWLRNTSSQFMGPSVLQLDRTDSNESMNQALQPLRTAGIEVAVLLGRRNDRLAVILLGTRRSGDPYFKTDLEFIESLAELASVALENALLYRERLEMLEYSQRLVESLDAAVAATDVNGRLTSFNRSAASLFSLEHQASPFTLDALPPQVAWALAIALRTQSQPRGVEVMIDHPQRGSIPAVLSAASLHDDRDQTRGALVVVTDLTAVKALEQNQRRVEHLTLMARFYAGIAHEIRSPLTSISNFVSLLTERFDDPDYRETAAKLLPLEVDRITQLADRLRLMAPSEGGQMTKVDLAALLRDLVSLHAPRLRESSIRMKLACPTELPPVQGDARQLIQLFLNLLNNGIEAMPDGGQITIDVGYRMQPGESGLISVQISDEGTGIDGSIIGKVFEPFFTTKASGTGLGLSICREIADFHRAALSLRRRDDGRGTVAEVRIFSTTLPRAPETLKMSTAAR